MERRVAAAAAQTIYDLGFPLGFKGSADIPGTKDGVTYPLDFLRAARHHFAIPGGCVGCSFTLAGALVVSLALCQAS